MKEMMAEMKMELEIEMNERLSLAEGKTKAELAATKDELAATKDELAVAKDELAATKAVLDQTEAYVITKDDLAITKEALMSKTDELEREVAILKAPPYIHACGSNFNYLSGSSGTIPYTTLLYSSTNTEGGGLDITTGVFTAPTGGSYTVYWDTLANLYQRGMVHIYLQKNGENIQESVNYSYYSGNDYYVGD